LRPNNPAQKDPINGKKINNKYMEKFLSNQLKNLEEGERLCLLASLEFA
jgi:hypothetical protein